MDSIAGNAMGLEPSAGENQVLPAFPMPGYDVRKSLGKDGHPKCREGNLGAIAIKLPHAAGHVLQTLVAMQRGGIGRSYLE